MRLTVLNVAYSLAPLGPDAVGDAEVDSIRPEACRREAEARFSADRTARHYLDIYARLAGRAAEGVRAYGEGVA